MTLALVLLMPMQAAHPESPTVFDVGKARAVPAPRRGPDGAGSMSAPERCSKGRAALDAFTTHRQPGLLQEAVGWFNDAVAADERYAPAYLGLALAISELDLDRMEPARREAVTKLAQQSLDRAEALDPDMAELLQVKALLARSLGDGARAETFARESIARHPELPLAYWVLAAVQSTDEAVITLLKDGLAVAQRPVDRWLLNMELSRSYGESDPALQLEASRRALEAVPETWWPLNNAAKALVQLGRHEEAATTARQALALRESTWPRAYLVEALLQLERIDEMRAEAALLQDPDGLSYLCIKLNGRGRFEDALSLADRAIQLAPQLVGPHTQRGHALYNLHRREEAVAEYQRAVRSTPRDRTDRIDQSDSYFFMASIANDEGRFQDAERWCRNALDLYPKHKAANTLLASVKSRQP